MAPRTINGIGVGDYIPFPDFEPCRGVAIVAGCAPGWQEELLKAKTLFDGATVYLLNRAGWKEMGDYWVSLHPMEIFIGSTTAVRISDRNLPGVDMAFPIATKGGSSALLATKVALVMGHEMVITAGVHLVGPYKTMQGRWLYYEETLAGRVFSVSAEGTFIRDHFGGIDDIR